MMDLLHLSKERKRQWLISGGLFTVLWCLLGVTSSLHVGFVGGTSAFMMIVLFGFFKILDHQEKQTHYEKTGYTYLTTTKKGETVLSLTPTPNKFVSDSYTMLAVFDTKGYLVRQTRLLQEDIKLAQQLVTKS